MTTFEEMLKETERRYNERSEQRKEFEKRLAAGDILHADTPDRIAKRLDHLHIDRATAETVVERGFSFSSLRTIAEEPTTDPIVIERVLGKNELIGIRFLEMSVLVARSVGRVHIYNASGLTIGYGTGFMVSPHLLMTNNHVLNTAQRASFSQVEFNYQIGLDGRSTRPIAFDFDPLTFFITDERLDYTIVAVDPRGAEAELQAFGWNQLIAAEGKVIKGERLNIVQHPNGEPKQAALRANRLVDILDNYLHYRTDTAPGSSGSPVFNDQWEVVALHHSGVPKRDSQGNILTRDGQIWSYQMGEHRIDWIANEGVRVSRILDHVQQQPLSTTQRELLADMLDVGPAWSAGDLSPVSMAVTSNIAASQISGAQLSTSSRFGKTRATWTIPLTISIDLSAPSQADTDLAEPLATPSSTSPPREPDGTDDAELREALEELEAARQRPYYDAESDIASRDAYYSNLPQGLTPSTLYRHMHELLQTTHATRLPYRPSRYLYPWVDLYPDQKLHSIYSGDEYDPETFIREDHRISLERASHVRELIAREGALTSEHLAEEIAAIEARLPYNCEHVVPQSWFDRHQPMRGDLHHLFACEVDCNSFRGNRAFFDFSDYDEAISDECGRIMTNKFEPEAGKGPVARATLYFLLRYPGQIRSDQQQEEEWQTARLPMLVEWHEQYPVTEHERHRNRAIFEIQGNRNPLIDFPEVARRIDFTLAL